MDLPPQVERRKGIARVFDSLDVDVTEILDITELERFDDAMAHNPLARRGIWTDTTTKKLLKAIDSSGDGTVSRDEFIMHYNTELPTEMLEFRDAIGVYEQAALWAASVGSKNLSEQSHRRRTLVAVFDLIDMDVSGSLTKTELDELAKAAHRTQGYFQGEFIANLCRVLFSQGGESITRSAFLSHLDATLPFTAEHFGRRVREMLRAANEMVTGRQKDADVGGAWRAGVVDPSILGELPKCVWDVEHPTSDAGSLTLAVPSSLNFYQQLAQQASGTISTSTLNRRFGGQLTWVGGSAPEPIRTIYGCPSCGRIFHAFRQGRSLFGVPVPGIMRHARLTAEAKARLVAALAE